MSEPFIPVRRMELVDLLCADPGLADADRERFQTFCKLVVAIFHFEYNRHLERLKASYAPFDPDSDCIALKKWRAEERQQRLNELFSEFGWLMDRANFRHLSADAIAPAVGASSNWGLVVDVDFHMFERLAIFARGDGEDRRALRRASGLWRKQEVEVPIYRRLVMILKLRPHKRLGKQINTDGVYLQVFKNIPKLDINMLLPGARVKMRPLDRGKIGLPFISGVGLALYNIADDVLNALFGWLSNPMPLFWGIATGAIGYGTRSYFSYVGTKQRYNLNLREVLYFQNLDTNAGVLLRIIDEAEEQECREAILAYYLLWRRAGEPGWTSRELEDAAEDCLDQQCGLKVAFEIGDAIAKLERLRLVEKTGECYRARPVTQALEVLDDTWNGFFKFTDRQPLSKACDLPAKPQAAGA
jgi:Protein of unknown function (DUF3754)